MKVEPAAEHSGVLPVDYDRVAPAYDRRYAARSYAGVDDALAHFLAGATREVARVGAEDHVATVARNGWVLAGVIPRGAVVRL